MDGLIKKHILTHLFPHPSEVALSDLDDSAVIDDIVFSTDSHTIQPLFFPGGDIGSLSVAGTINDVAVMGAKPIGLSCAFVIEEGFPMNDFETIVKSMGNTTNRAGVPIVTGDTKVVEKGALQQLIVNTAGIGKRSEFLDENFQVCSKRKSRWLVDSNLKAGDAIIISGSIADHGIALLSFREGYGFETQIKSDVAPLNDLMEKALKAGGVVSAKDPTRGGLANTVNEFAEKSQVGIRIQEEAIPISEGTLAACEMLGLDPLSIGNEGKVILGVQKERAELVLDGIRKHPLGKNAEIIGIVTKKREVILETVVGGKRILEPPVADPIPRIC
jgi:hydrogenase expression/formation protein HypE